MIDSIEDNISLSTNSVLIGQEELSKAIKYDEERKISLGTISFCTG